MRARGTSPAGIADLAAADPRSVSLADLAAVVAASTPGELREAARGPVRDLVIDVVLGRLEEFVDPGRWTGGPVRLALALTGRSGDAADDIVVLTLDGRTVTAERVPPGADGVAADVTIRADAVDLLLLVTGQEHPALQYLGGGIHLDGDPRLAIAAAACFQVPAGTGADGNGGTAPDLDPLAIDATSVAQVVAGLSDQDLRDRMAGGVRDVILAEIFARFADHLREDRTADTDAAIAWRITGREDGGVDHFLTVIDHGAVRVQESGSVAPRVSIQVQAADFLRLATGNANPAMLFMRRRITVRGDLGFAAQLTGMFRIPSR